MGRNMKYSLVGLTALSLMTFGCQSASEDAVSVTTTPKKLYVASGTCYSGSGITTYLAATSSRAVVKYDSETGASLGVFTDLNVGSNVSVGTVPQDMIDKGDHVLLLTDNSTNFGDRKIFKVNKADSSVYEPYAADPTAFTVTPAHIIREMTQDVDGTILFSKSVAIERINTLGVRIAKGGNQAWVNPAGATGTCANAAATLISGLDVMAPFTLTNQGKIIYLHAGATLLTNRISIVQRTGMLTTNAADCAGSTPAGGAATVAHANAPNLTGPVLMSATGPSMTSMIYIPTPAPATTSGKLIVSYSGAVNTAFDNNTTFNYGIVMWDITETSDTAATVTNPVILWRDHTIVWAPSAMAYDSTDNSLYVAVGGSPGLINQTTQNFGYNIEKFTLDINTPLMTRVSPNNQPFVIGNAYTKCISSMMLAD
jgi:hypothetical protein